MSRLAIIMACGSKADAAAGHLLSGSQGTIVQDLLGRCGVGWEACRVFAILGEAAPRNDAEGMEAWFDSHPWEGEALQGSISRLRGDLTACAPTMVLALGGAPLHLLREGNVAPRREKGAYAYPNSISDWRGSLFASEWAGCKALATYHPAWLARDWSLQAYAKADVRRCAAELAAGPELVLPKRKVIINNTLDDVLDVIDLITRMGRRGHLLSVDTEGGISSITMLGFALSTEVAHVIPFIGEAGESCWTEDEEVAIWEAAARLLEDPAVPKVMQNWQSDAFILAWSYGIVIKGLKHDVMLAAWECQPELEKGLASVASLYTREPFWKSKYNYTHRLAHVCGLDCMLTLECCGVLDRILQGGQRDHYAMNLSLLPSVLYSMLEGLPFDRRRARADLKALNQQIHETQHEINEAAWQAIMAGLRERGPETNEVNGPATSTHPDPRAARLAGWFGCLAVQRTGLSLNGAAGQGAARSQPGPAILALAAGAFGLARHSEKVEAIEERWQPMRWNGKRWVKDGKMAMADSPLFSGWWKDEPADPPPAMARQWMKPAPRTIKVSRPVAIASWETLERFCKDSCRDSLRRVRKLYEHNSESGHKSGDFTGSVEAGDCGGESAQGNGEDKPAARSGLRTAVLGELSSLLGIAINASSANQGGDCQWLLHAAWGLPKRFKKIVRTEDEASATDPRVTTDKSALLSLYARTQQPDWPEWRKHSKLRGEELKAWLAESGRRLKLVLRMRSLDKERGYLDVETDADGQLRYGLNLVQAATGRFAAYGSPTGKSKLNPQTVGKKHRHLYHT